MSQRVKLDAKPGTSRLLPHSAGGLFRPGRAGRRSLCTGAAGPCGLARAQAQAAPGGDAARGKQLYESRCVACHSVDAHRVGPSHQGVFGRKAGSAPGYAYSDALARSTVRWNARTLDAWLSDPEQLIPGQRMGYQVEQAADRADLIAYLSRLK